MCYKGCEEAHHKKIFLDKLYPGTGTITGRGFLDRYIREQGTIETQEEEDKVSGRTGGKKNNKQELASIGNSGSFYRIYKGIFTQGSFQCT